MRYISLESISKEVAESLSRAAKEGRDHDVIRDGLLLYLAVRGEGNEALNSIPLVYVQSAIARIMKRLAEPDDEGRPIAGECSFRGSKPPGVALAAGPNAFICSQCVAEFSKTFSQGAQGQ